MGVRLFVLLRKARCLAASLEVDLTIDALPNYGPGSSQGASRSLPRSRVAHDKALRDGKKPSLCCSCLPEKIVLQSLIRW